MSDRIIATFGRKKRRKNKYRIESRIKPGHFGGDGAWTTISYESNLIVALINAGSWWFGERYSQYRVVRNNASN